MKTLIELKAELDLANAQAAKLMRRDFRNHTGPSAEYKEAHRLARIAWKLWCNELDRSQGKNPAFPI